MNSTDLVDQFRSEMSDAVAPFLWSDTLVYSYVNDAQRMFCRLTNGIADSRTAAVTQLAIKPGVEWYDLHKSILKIRTATRGDTGRDLDTVNPENMALRGVRFDRTVGYVKYLVQGLEDHALRAWPVPNVMTRTAAKAAGATALGASMLPLVSSTGIYAGQSVSGTGVAPLTTVRSVIGNTLELSLPTTAIVADQAPINIDLTVNLAVFRLPLVVITDDGDQALEIDAQHHLHLLLWAKHLGYDKQDAETFDRRKSDDFAARFRSYCADVKKEQDRARRVVGTVAYGGI